MSNTDTLSRETTLHVRDHCLCLAAQRAARALGRRFDTAFRPLGLTNGQFSLMMALNRPDPPSIGSLATFLAMDRSTLTANLKPLEKRRLVKIDIDAADRRSRRLRLSGAGRRLLRKAVPIWTREHEKVDQCLGTDAAGLRDRLWRLV